MSRKPRSTARFISYDLRPTKQSERRIILDLLKIAGDSGLPISDYRYIGLGANRFYDFLLIHRYIGVRDMISLEHDAGMFKRAAFNVPYSFISMRHETISHFISEDSFEKPSICWLDYDGGIGSHVVHDIADLGTKLKVGDFCFITVYGGPPHVVDRVNDQERLNWLQDNIGEVSGEVSIEDVERASFSGAVHKILIAAFRNAFAARRDGQFVPFLQVKYADSLPMVTVGGGLLAPGHTHGFKERAAKAVPFLFQNPSALYEIKSLHLTERERMLFDRAVTNPKRQSADYKALQRLGFKEGEICAYRDLIRYLPRYVEAIV